MTGAWHSTHNLSGLEPQPLTRQRQCSEEMQESLDNILAWADTLLTVAIKGKHSLRSYHPRSIAVFYEDTAASELDHSGWQVRYTSLEAGKPTVCCYNMDGAVCWRGPEELAAEKLRMEASLRRYSLFVRANSTWQYRHCGQLPFGPVSHPPKRY